MYEFRKQDFGRASSDLIDLSRAADPQVRAAAWLRLGRNCRKGGRWQEAARAYGKLRALAAATVNGLPAELLARDALCSMFEERGETEPLKREASALYTDLGRGRWKINEAVYSYYAGQARQRMGFSASDASRSDALALSEAAQALWRDWQLVRRGEAAAADLQQQRLADRPVLIAWRSSKDRMAALAAGGGFCESAWLQLLKPMLATHGATLTIIDKDGEPVWGDAPPAGVPASVRLASATRLPWMIEVSAVPNAAEVDSKAVRRRLLTAGFCFMVFLVVSASYFLGRAVAKEVRVAQQQSDFVAAVSHEFRTPLTSLSQFTELLAKGRVTDEEDRQRFYGVLAHESQRLRRLVEGLLNFGRMEAGVLNYRFESLDPAAFVRQLVTEFEGEKIATGHRIEWSAGDAMPQIRADREALGCVIWNLLDNAVKYSPDRPSIWVRIAQADGRVSIAVRDEGAGIARAEQATIFKKFTRGTSARTLNIRGTGIGLAMAHQIVHDHGGEITVNSEPGKGSTFTVFLPVVERT